MIRKIIIFISILCIIIESSCFASDSEDKSMQNQNFKAPIIANHQHIKLDQIPLNLISEAKNTFHIAYGHTSHGSQITDGLSGLTSFKGYPFIYKKDLSDGSLDLRDNPFGGEMDLGNPDNKTWADKTKKYLDKNKDINVVMWAWCGQLSNAGRDFVQNYLDLMQKLETQYPNVTFIYMTGHLDGTGENGTLESNNNLIRDFCKKGNKVLFDYADIESFNPDGEYFGDRFADASCEYDSDGDKKTDKNWALDWQSSHKKGVDWFDCNSAHSEAINANMKAYAFWWMLSEMAGQKAETEKNSGSKAKNFEFFAEQLQSINLFQGTDKGFDLNRTPTRLEGAAMLTRLLGGEEESKMKAYSHPFKDAQNTWGNRYVGYLYDKNLTKGVSENRFGCNLMLEAYQYVTFLLRVLGYSDNFENGDFKFQNALETSRDLNLVDAEYFSSLKNGTFTRGDMAKLTCLFLKAKLKEKDTTLIEKLVNYNVIEKSASDEFIKKLQ